MTVRPGGLGRLLRLPLVVAVLLGLFLMPGAPMSTTAGRHGPTPAMAPVKPMAGMAGSGARADAVAFDQQPGTICLATAERPGGRLPTPAQAAELPLAAAGIVPLPIRNGTGNGSRRGGPPGSGRRLLLETCVSRT